MRIKYKKLLLFLKFFVAFCFDMDADQDEQVKKIPFFSMNNHQHIIKPFFCLPENKDSRLYKTNIKPFFLALVMYYNDKFQYVFSILMLTSAVQIQPRHIQVGFKNLSSY